jgi:aspartyl-tRNA synthetase
LSELLHEQELGDWRRTHYSKEILPTLNDKQITVMGWVSSTRSHGNIQFVIIRDGLGEYKYLQNVVNVQIRFWISSHV